MKRFLVYSGEHSVEEEIDFYVGQLRNSLSDIGIEFTFLMEQSFRKEAGIAPNLFDLAERDEINFYIDKLREDLGDYFSPEMGREFVDNAKKSQNLFKLFQDIEIELCIGKLKQSLGDLFTHKEEQRFRRDVIKLRAVSRNLFDIRDTLVLQMQRPKISVKAIDKRETVGAVHKVYSDLRVGHAKSFVSIKPKESGATSGFVAAKAKRDATGEAKRDDADEREFMIKIAVKTYDKNGLDRNDNPETMFFVNEFVTAPFYKYTLFDYAPIISLVEGGNDNEICFRSKFLNAFKTIAEFTESSDNYSIGPKYAFLKAVKNQEKVFAAMLAWGEFDVHPGNIGVVKSQHGTQTDYTMSKIDHGWSGSQFFDNPSDMLQNFFTAYQVYGYGYLDYTGNGEEMILPLDANKLREAIDQITLMFSNSQIESLVANRIHELKQLGFDIEGLEFTTWENDTRHTRNQAIEIVKTFSSLDDLGDHYVSHFKKQVSTLREVSKRLEIISQIDFAPKGSKDEKEWKEGRWLTEIRGEDPVAWAKRNGKTIGGRSPDEWVELMGEKASDHQYKHGG